MSKASEMESKELIDLLIRESVSLCAPHRIVDPNATEPDNARLLELWREIEARMEGKPVKAEVERWKKVAYKLLEYCVHEEDCPATPGPGGDFEDDVNCVCGLGDLGKMLHQTGKAVTSPYYLAECPKCGWRGSSEECAGTNDEDCLCPVCHADCDEAETLTIGS